MDGSPAAPHTYRSGLCSPLTPYSPIGSHGNHSPYGFGKSASLKRGLAPQVQYLCTANRPKCEPVDKSVLGILLLIAMLMLGSIA
jgi:hypothetical protein